MRLKNGILEIERELSELDRIVLDFTQRLGEWDIDYVIVSGYVAVLTGRSRSTEDIDVIFEEMSREEVEEFVENLFDAGYWCVNAERTEVYDMLTEGLAPRFAEGERVIPNFEVNFPTDEFERTALGESLTAKIDSNEINISPLELQIAYKLYLGTERDWEDALHLYRLFEEDLNEKKLEGYSRKLDVRDELDGLREA